MGQDLPLRQLVGPNAMAGIGPFGALEAIVQATTVMPYGGTEFADAGAGLVTMPYDGVIVAMTANCEAGSNFTVQATLNGTPDTGVTMTVNSAAEVQKFKPSEYVAFSAEDQIGANVIADTTSKDLSLILWVVFDLSGD